jgi:hypothetical protein
MEATVNTVKRGDTFSKKVTKGLPKYPLKKIRLKITTPGARAQRSYSFRKRLLISFPLKNIRTASPVVQIRGFHRNPLMASNDQKTS